MYNMYCLTGVTVTIKCRNSKTIIEKLECHSISKFIRFKMLRSSKKNSLAGQILYQSSDPSKKRRL